MDNIGKVMPAKQSERMVGLKLHKQAFSDLRVQIASVRHIASHVKEFTLAPTDGIQLPGFTAGSFVSVKASLDHEIKFKPYSLTSSPKHLENYRIIVSNGSSTPGVSSYLHESATVGSFIEISYPVDGMELEQAAEKHVFIAGGMGVTPFLSHLSLLSDTGEAYEIHYTYPTFEKAYFLGWLKSKLPSHALFSYASREDSRLDTNKIVASQPFGTHFYVSGPRSLVEGVVASASSFGLPAGQIHFERSMQIDPSFLAYLEGWRECTLLEN